MLEHREIFIKYIDIFIEKDLQNLTLNYTNESFLYFVEIDECIFNINGSVKDYAKLVNELKNNVSKGNLDSYEYYDLKRASFESNTDSLPTATENDIHVKEYDEEKRREVTEEELQSFRKKLTFVLDKAKTVFDSINDNRGND